MWILNIIKANQKIKELKKDLRKAHENIDYLDKEIQERIKRERERGCYTRDLCEQLMERIVLDADNNIVEYVKKQPFGYEYRSFAEEKNNDNTRTN